MGSLLFAITKIIHFPAKPNPVNISQHLGNCENAAICSRRPLACVILRGAHGRWASLGTKESGGWWRIDEVRWWALNIWGKTEDFFVPPYTKRPDSTLNIWTTLIAYEAFYSSLPPQRQNHWISSATGTHVPPRIRHYHWDGNVFGPSGHAI